MLFLVVLLVGPFGVVQLWRLRESGRRTTAFVCLFVASYYVIQFNTSATTHMWFAIVTNLVFVLSLFSPAGKRACQVRLSEIDILIGPILE
jgi:hypothetical protein